jgi:GTP-binding protein EngB required for normal cell division
MDKYAEDIRRKAEEANSTPVRIALFGQPGAGKSSLINAIIGEEKAKVGVTTDTTQDLEEYNWNGLTLCDLPGYGTAKFPTTGYLERFNIPSFDVFLCVSAGKFTAGDTEFYQKLRYLNKICIFVRNKSDSIKQKGKTFEELTADIIGDLHRMTGHTDPVLFTSCDTGEGLDAVIKSIERSLFGLKLDRFRRSAKAYSKDFLDRKRSACEEYSILAAASAAAVNLVPVPGLGFTADVAAITALFAAITKDFGLNDTQKLNALAKMYPALTPFISSIIQGMGEQGAIWLLKRFAGRVVASEASKYIPFIGPIIAASLSFLTIKYAASYQIDECYKVAEKILKEKLSS